MEEYVVIKEIGLTPLLKAAARGGALYLYLPKDLVEAYGIMAGDLIEAKLGKIWRSRKYIKEAKKDEGKVQNVLVTSQARGVTTEMAKRILGSVKKVDLDAVVDLIISHLTKEREIDEV